MFPFKNHDVHRKSDRLRDFSMILTLIYNIIGLQLVTGKQHLQIFIRPNFRIIDSRLISILLLAAKLYVHFLK
jgi:hypothetical protein